MSGEQESIAVDLEWSELSGRGMMTAIFPIMPSIGHEVRLHGKDEQILVQIDKIEWDCSQVPARPRARCTRMNFSR